MFPKLKGIRDVQFKILSYIPDHYYGIVKEVLRVPHRTLQITQNDILIKLIIDGALACLRFLVEERHWDLDQKTRIAISFRADKEIVCYCYERDYSLTKNSMEMSVVVNNHEEAYRALPQHPWDPHILLREAVRSDCMWAFEEARIRMGVIDIHFADKAWTYHTWEYQIPVNIVRWYILRGFEPPNQVQALLFKLAFACNVNILHAMKVSWDRWKLDEAYCDRLYTLIPEYPIIRIRLASWPRSRCFCESPERHANSL